MKKILFPLVIAVSFGIFGCEKQKPEQKTEVYYDDGKLPDPALAGERARLKDLLAKTNKPQVAILEEHPRGKTPGTIALIENSDQPLGIKGSFKMSGEPAISLTMYNKSMSHQFSMTIVKSIIPKSGTIKLEPTMCGEMGKAKIYFEFLVNKEKYEPSQAYADCENIEGSMSADGKFLKISFKVSVIGQYFTVDAKVRN